MRGQISIGPAHVIPETWKSWTTDLDERLLDLYWSMPPERHPMRTDDMRAIFSHMLQIQVSNTRLLHRILYLTKGNWKGMHQETDQ